MTSRPSRGRTALLLALALSALPSGLEGQELEALVSRFAGAWGREDTGALQDLLAPSVRLEMEGHEYLGVPPRQAAASVDRLFRGLDPAPPRVTRQGDLGGDGDRGYAELTWSPVAPGSTDPASYLIFLGLRRSPDGWRISELRILR